MRTLRAALVLSIVTILGGCSSRVDVGAEEDAIRATSARWLELTRDQDAEGVADLFAEDGAVYWEDRTPTSGTAAIREFMAESFAENPDAEGSFGPDRVYVATSGDLAVELGAYEDPTGQGRYITVHRKLDGAWKVQADMSIDAAPDGGAPDWAQEALAVWYERFNNRDAEGIAALYATNAVVGDATNRAELMERFRDRWAERDETCSGSHDEFSVAGNIAVGRGRDTCVARGADGVSTTVRSTWIAIHERQPDGTWLLIRDSGVPLGP